MKYFVIIFFVLFYISNPLVFPGMDLGFIMLYFNLFDKANSQCYYRLF